MRVNYLFKHASIPNEYLQESRFLQILLISYIAEIQEELTNTLTVELCPDNASRIHEVSN